MWSRSQLAEGLADVLAVVQVRRGEQYPPVIVAHALRGQVGEQQRSHYRTEPVDGLRGCGRVVDRGGQRPQRDVVQLVNRS